MVKTNRTIRTREAHEDSQNQMDLKRKQRELDLTRQMETAQGRRVIMLVLDKLGYQQNIGDMNAAVYGKTAKQAVANDLAKELKRINPENFMLMEIESQD